METLGIKLMEMLTKKVMAYEIENTKLDMDMEIPTGDESDPIVRMKVKVEIGSLKLEIDNSEK